MTLIDKFLETVTDEFGNKIDFSNVEAEGFDGIIFLGPLGTDIYIQKDHYTFNSTLFSDYQKEMIEAFVEYIQQKMKEHKAFVKDKINTQNSLK